MNFDWSPRPIAEWQNLLKQASKVNWMQTWPYAEACFYRDHKPSKLATINVNNEVVGLMAVQQIKLGPIQIVNLNRGPIWLKQETQEEDFLSFAQAFRNEFPKSILKRLRWLPDWELTPPTIDRLMSLGFKLRQESFQTIWIDLSKSESQLRSSLKQKWRNGLNKFERSDVKIEVDYNPFRLQPFLNFYLRHKTFKNFHGPSKEFLDIELKTAFKMKEAFMLWAFHDGQPIAGMAVCLHGSSASYRVGWNSQVGRDLKAHYGLIWNALLICQNRGIKNFDLGGVMPIEAVGVTHFKLGLGGKLQEYSFLGG